LRTIILQTRFAISKVSQNNFFYRVTVESIAHSSLDYRIPFPARLLSWIDTVVSALSS